MQLSAHMLYACTHTHHKHPDIQHHKCHMLQVLSSVLYMTEAGGPTLVLDQTPEGKLADRGWLVQPCPNQLLSFKGNLLHGEIPGQLPRCLPLCLRLFFLTV